MKLFGSKVAFLPLGGSGKDWQQEGCAAYQQMVSRLRTAGEMAKQEGITIGIRTGMGAKFDKKLLKKVGSSQIKVYYNFQDAADHHRDICKELRKLGAQRIVQIHASNTDSVNLEEDPEINLPKIRRRLTR